MKRCLTIVAGILLAVGPLAAQNDASLEVGIGVRDITPPLGYPMSGYYHARGADGVLDPLHAKAVVFRQGNVLAAVVVGDLIGITHGLATEVRRRVETETGIPAGHLVVAATHAHTGPSYAGRLREYLEQEKDDGYASRLVAGMAGAVGEARKDLRASKVSAGGARQETPVSFCRRFVMADGTVRTWANYRDPKTVREEGPVDPAVGMIFVSDPKARRPRAAFLNFALHLDTVGGSKFSADFPHPLEESLRVAFGEGFTSVFSAGCCGDINHVNPRTPHRNKMSEIGQALAITVKAAVPALRPVAEPALAVRRKVIRAPLQEVTGKDLAWADGMIARDRKGEKLPFLEEVKAYKFRKVDGLRGTSDDGTLAVEVQAIRIDANTAIVSLPGEVFVELGLAIKRRSPFATTIVMELANRNETAYIPTRLAYTGGGYETTNSTLQPGAGETLVETAVALLRELALPAGK